MTSLTMILSVILKIKVLPVKLNDISSRNVFTLSEDQERKTMQINWRGFIILLDSVFKVLSLKKFTVYSIMLHAQLIKYHTLLKRNIHGKGNKSFQTMLIFFDYQPFFCFLCISAYSTLKDGMIKSVTKSKFFTLNAKHQSSKLCWFFSFGGFFSKSARRRLLNCFYKSFNQINRSPGTCGHFEKISLKNSMVPGDFLMLW